MKKKKKQKQSKSKGPDCMIRVGGQDKGTVASIRDALLAILNTTAGDSVKQTAMATLGQAAKVENITISGCNFQMDVK